MILIFTQQLGLMELKLRKMVQWKNALSELSWRQELMEPGFKILRKHKEHLSSKNIYLTVAVFRNGFAKPHLQT